MSARSRLARNLAAAWVVLAVLSVMWVGRLSTFPVALLLPMAAQRRRRDLASVVAWSTAATLLALGVFGPAVFGKPAATWG